MTLYCLQTIRFTVLKDIIDYRYMPPTNASKCICVGYQKEQSRILQFPIGMAGKQKKIWENSAKSGKVGSYAICGNSTEIYRDDTWIYDVDMTLTEPFHWHQCGERWTVYRDRTG